MRAADAFKLARRRHDKGAERGRLHHGDASRDRIAHVVRCHRAVREDDSGGHRDDRRHEREMAAMSPQASAFA